MTAGHSPCMNAWSRSARTPDDPTVDWRDRLLRRAGFPPDLAREIARDSRYDLHALIELTERGCPPAVAGRILAPLDPASPPTGEQAARERSAGSH